MKLNTFLLRILGNVTLTDYLFYLFFIGIGVLISVRFIAKGRNKISDNTPYKFNIKFFIVDNLPRVFLSIIKCFVLIRFWTEITGHELSEYSCIFIGLFFDQSSELLAKFKEKYKAKIRAFFV